MNIKYKRDDLMKRKRLLIVAIITTIILYFAGILTGYFVQVKVLSKTQEELEKVREEFFEYRQNLENLQLEQLYLTTYQGELSCDFLVSTINDINQRMHYFWSKLPSRLEKYEKFEEIEPEYTKLKRDYTILSIRAWLISLNVKEKCREEILPVLYFYSTDSSKCEKCVEQGIVLDEVKKRHNEFSAFLVDFDLDEPIVKAIKTTYNITKLPAFVIDKKVYQDFTSLDEFEKIISS
jgi:hypothetical protein